jgi:hypothetical protein
VESFAYLLISKLKTSWVIDYEKSDKPFCSVFGLNGNSDNRFYEYFLNQASRPPRELEEKHKKLGVDEFGYLFIEIELTGRHDGVEGTVEELFDSIISRIQKSRLTNNIYSFVNQSLVVEIEGLLMCCSAEFPYIRNVSGRFLEEEAKYDYCQPCIDSMHYWHRKDEENARDSVTKSSDKIKKLFSSVPEYRKIKNTVIDVYMYTQKNGIRSFFDGKRKLIEANINELRSLYSTNFLAKHNGAISQLSLASFGFEDSNAIICAGFLKIINTNYDINDRHKWDDYDLWLHIALKESATFGDALFTLFWERYWNATPLLQFAHLREIIPGGFYMPPNYGAFTDIAYKEKEFSDLTDPAALMSSLSMYVSSFRETYGWKKERGQSIEEYVMDRSGGV